ncbi:hypothetical protein MVEN_00106300 [Mycena venus]|uniref:Uncharacterized protein n=1 Tax=Mycena venus TaxID=2733690 RepID=A0A8H6Z7J4_9AGAR|nr:hypothetical protein MVEN_00106300 [Mycena venus]
MPVMNIEDLSNVIPAQIIPPVPAVPSPFGTQVPGSYFLPPPWAFPYTVPGYPNYVGYPHYPQALGTLSQPPVLAPDPAQSTSAHHPPIRVAISHPTEPVPSSSDTITHSAAPQTDSSSEDEKPPSRSTVSPAWDPWPDGNFEQDFTWKEFHAANELPVHWASSEKYQSACGNVLATFVAIRRQTGHESTGLHGPEKSVSEISPVLFNKDRIKSERRTVKRQGNLAYSDFTQFAQFEIDNPGFVIFSQFGAVTVIVMQTSFMVAQLVKNHIIHRDAINSIVSNGAHGYFLEHNAILLMSSSYCLGLDCWVPGIMTYANGGTQEHYFLHFLAMFESMASYAEKKGCKITDAAFKNVVDFSAPQRLGFVEAFVVFWRRRKDDFRTDEELRKVASSLLKGCQEHFRDQVNRIKKISAVVPPGLQDAFVNQAMGLLEAVDYDGFNQRLDALLKNFPKTDKWVEWWARESYAKMLFEPFREMPFEEWDSIPSTTNPAESQHYKIYSAIGKKHELISGLKGLRQLADHYALLESAASGRRLETPSPQSVPPPQRQTPDSP